MKHGKRIARASSTRPGGQGLAEAVKLVKQTARAKFDETIVVSSHLGVDPAALRPAGARHRGAAARHGKSLRVLVLCQGREGEGGAGGGRRLRRAPTST